jgi:hypothetical protein
MLPLTAGKEQLIRFARDVVPLLPPDTEVMS